MSRSGYSEDLDSDALARWRGAVTRALRGKRGQAFLRELVAALDALPTKALIAEELMSETGDVCAIGAVCKARAMDVAEIDESDPQDVAEAVGIARAMSAEIAYVNDEQGHWKQTPEERFLRVRAWAASRLLRSAPA